MFFGSDSFKINQRHNITQTKKTKLKIAISSSVARGVQGVQRAPGVTPKGGDTRSYFR